VACEVIKIKIKIKCWVGPFWTRLGLQICGISKITLTPFPVSFPLFHIVSYPFIVVVWLLLAPMSTDEATAEEDGVSILSFDNLEEDYALPGSDGRIHHWLSQQCRFGLEEKEIPTPYEIGGPGELLSTVLAKHRDSSSTISEEGGEAALRADSPLLGFGVDDERTLVDPLHFPSATYVRDLPDVCFSFSFLLA
jgi:hypothetical protein